MKLDGKVTRREAIKAGTMGAASLLIAGASGIALPKSAYAEEQEKIYYNLDSVVTRYDIMMET